MAEENKNEIIFVGKGNILPNEKISVSVCLSKLPKDAIRNDNGEEWITLTLQKLKVPRDRQTHSLRVYYPNAPKKSK